MDRIILFRNIREVIKAENVLLENGFSVVVRPVPSSISSECGMCLAVQDNQEAGAVELLEAMSLNFKIAKNG
jgi:hypothetical protein